MNQLLLLKAPSAAVKPVLQADFDVFTREAVELFTKKRQGHLIHRMYMTDAALGYWSEFMKHQGYYVPLREIISVSCRNLKPCANISLDGKNLTTKSTASGSMDNQNRLGWHHLVRI